MSILNYTPVQIGLVNVVPAIAAIQTNDTEATVLGTGYLNQLIAQQGQPSLPCLAIVSTQTSLTAAPKVGTYNISYASGNWSLTATSQPGDVVLPTKANHLATYTDTSGTLSEDAATAINGGNIQAGLSGTAGYLASFPGTASKGSLRLTAVANTGDTLVTISNAAHGQATVVSIPDGGQATTKFIIADSAGTQHIATGSLEVDQGNISAGSSGHQGIVYAYPAGASAGRLALSAIGNTGNTDVIISNAIMGQASTITIPDPGAATAKFLLDSGTNSMVAGSSIVAAKVNGVEAANAVTASGMAGTITTSSLTTAGGSSYAITWTNTFVTSTSVILITIAGGTNSTENITITCTPGSGSATLTIYNNTAATNLNGTIIMSYLVM